METVIESHETGNKFERLPYLASALLQVNIFEEAKQLRLQDAWTRGTGRSSKTLVKYPDLRIILVSMRAKTRMKDHRTDARIAILALTGHLRIHTPHALIELPAGNLLALDSAVAHDVEALKQSTFLLVISWPDGKQKPGTTCERSK